MINCTTSGDIHCVRYEVSVVVVVIVVMVVVVVAVVVVVVVVVVYMYFTVGVLSPPSAQVMYSNQLLTV